VPRLADLRHPVALGMLVISVACAISVAIWAPWSGRAGWVLLWGVLAYAAAVLAVRERPDPVDLAPERVASPAGTSTEVPLEDLVRLTEEALRRLNNPALLAASGLIARLPLTVAAALERGAAEGAPSPLEQARGLRLALEASIERLKPGPRNGDPPGEFELLQYSIIHEEYVRGRPNNQIMARLSIGEGTFHRYRRQGIRALAGDLATQEHHAPAQEAVS
jgi:hypothetical protein